MDSYKAIGKGFKITLALLENYMTGTCDPNQANARLDTLRAKYHTLLNAYEICPDDDPDIERELETFSDRFYKIHTMVTDFLCEIRSNSVEPSLREPMANIKLPDIKLPTFDGNFLKWPQFRDTFTALISNNT